MEMIPASAEEAPRDVEVVPAGDDAVDYKAVGWLIAVVPMAVAIGVAAVPALLLWMDPLSAGLLGAVAGVATLWALARWDHSRWPGNADRARVWLAVLSVPLGVIAYLWGRSTSRAAAWGSVVLAMVWGAALIVIGTAAVATSSAQATCMDMGAQIVQDTGRVDVTVIKAVSVVDATPGAEQCVGLATMKRNGETVRLSFWLDGDTMRWEPVG